MGLWLGNMFLFTHLTIDEPRKKKKALLSIILIGYLVNKDT